MTTIFLSQRQRHARTARAALALLVLAALAAAALAGGALELATASIFALAN